MMSIAETKIKRWIELIQTQKLNEVAEDIEEYITEKPDRKLNKHIFKLLLYLSHTADKCDKQEYMIGDKIYKVAKLLCSLLVEIPDGSKFVSCLFHIIRCLQATCMYREAWEICIYLKSDNLCDTEGNVSEVLAKISYLWHHTTNNKFNILKNNPSYAAYEQLKTILKYELGMIQITYKDYTKNVLMKISSYLQKIASISKNSKRFFDDFCTFVIEYLEENEICLNNDEKHSICHYMLHIVGTVISENTNEGSITLAQQLSYGMCRYFKKILVEDKECYESFAQFESICATLIKPVEELTNDSSKAVKENIKNLVKIASKHGYFGAVKWSAFSTAQILEPLLIYWEACIKAGKISFLSNGTLLETITLAMQVSIFFVKQTSDKCKSCHKDECDIRRDIYNAVVIKNRCINLVTKLSANDLTKDVCALSIKILEQNVASIYEMKQSNCGCWVHLWTSCGTLIYNLGVTSALYYEESACLFSLLCTCILQFEGLEPKCQYIALQNPISSTLHRLCTVHYNKEKYREAMTAAALNGLLSYNEPNSKAFRMWANIKHKCLTSKVIMEMSMLACLKLDKKQIEQLGLYIDFSKYDLVKLCLREVKGLQEAKVNLGSAIQTVLDTLILLKAPQIQYIYAVQLLGYHLLSFEYNGSVIQCLKRTLTAIKQAKRNSASDLCLEANFEFYAFVGRLHEISKKTQSEMESAKFALYAPRLSEAGENESRDVVPAYTMINTKEDSRLMSSLQTALKKWKASFDLNIDEIVNGWEPTIALRTLVIAGEYARLYRYQSCEIDAWNLAYRLASKLEDHHTIIYVTARSISLRHIDQKWIDTATDLATKLKDSQDERIIDAIAIFWISLSDYYVECGTCDAARTLMDNARRLPGIAFVSKPAIYLYSLDRILYNCQLYKEDMDHVKYSRYIVEAHYAMVNINEELSLKTWKHPEKYLFSLDVLCSTSINLALRINSLLSFREITAHLVRRLKTAQSLGATIRVAEILKSLCYLDLLRVQLSDCEVKLQGLEHILNIETFQLSMKTNLPKVTPNYQISTPTRIIDPVRDISQNDASPVLRNKVFDLPEFLYHSNCGCYPCKNISYQYLVFASTHIRGQLYALQKHSAPALQHFHGAFQIRKTLAGINSESVGCLPKKSPRNRFSWQENFYAVDYILLLLNFSHFLKNDMRTKQKGAFDVILLAMKMCETYNLEGHPVYVSVKESFLDYRFQRTFADTDYSAFTVANQRDIDISKYMQEPKIEQKICKTPVLNNIRPNKPIMVRRNRTPPLLKLTKVSMSFSDDEEDSNEFSPPVEHKKQNPASRTRLTRRRILEDEYIENSGTPNKEDSVQERNKSLIKELVLAHNGRMENISVKEIVVKIAPLVPNVTKQLEKLADCFDVPATNDNVQKLIERVENLKIEASTERRSRNLRNTRQSKPTNSSEHNSKINEVIELFKDMSTGENSSIPRKTDLSQPDAADSVPDGANNCKVQTKRSLGVQKMETFQGSINTTEESEPVNVKRSTRRTAVSKERQSIRVTRKSKERFT